jgi:hypothetical protein
VLVPDLVGAFAHTTFLNRWEIDDVNLGMVSFGSKRRIFIEHANLDFRLI